MDNQTRNHLNLQKHIADQDHIIRVRNAEIAALRKRAEKAEKERDEAVSAREECRSLAVRYAEQPRPLTPDDITDEMVERGARQYIEEDYSSWERSPALAKNNARESVRGILTAALTDPPRPEGAEHWEDFLIGSLDYQALTDQQIADLADRIAEEMNQ